MTTLSPQTLTKSEQAALFAVTAAHPRDHLAFSFALGTGLRLDEIVGLDMGDLYSPAGQPKSRVRVRAEIAKGGRAADVFLLDLLVNKLRQFREWKLAQHEPLDPGAPLFCNQGRRRISKRRVQIAFAAWQAVAGLDRHYSFHCLRHTAVSSVWRLSRDLFLAQRFAADRLDIHACERRGAAGGDAGAGTLSGVCVMGRDRILGNRAPVLTLWATVVAERLGYAPSVALTLGKSIAGLNAQSKGQRLGLFEEPKATLEAAAKRKAVAVGGGAVELMGRLVPVTGEGAGVRAA